MSGAEPMNATARGTAPVDRRTVAGGVGEIPPADMGHRARWSSKADEVATELVMHPVQPRKGIP